MPSFVEREEIGDRLNIVMEYIDGGTLADQVQQYKDRNQLIPEVQCLQWFIQILRALEYMHSKNILHR